MILLNFMNSHGQLNESSHPENCFWKSQLDTTIYMPSSIQMTSDLFSRLVPICWIGCRILGLNAFCWVTRYNRSLNLKRETCNPGNRAPRLNVPAREIARSCRSFEEYAWKQFGLFVTKMSWDMQVKLKNSIRPRSLQEWMIVGSKN